MDSLGDFFVTLYSSTSAEYFPRNTSSDFTAQLPRNLYCPEESYEVGLYSLSLHQKKLDPVIAPKPIAHSVSKKTFFGEEQVQAEVYERIEAEIIVPKPPQDAIEYFQQLVYTRFNQLGLKLLITEFQISETESKTRISFTDPKDRYLEIPGPIARVLGFSQTTFRPEDYESEGFRDLEYYASIPSNTYFTFRLYNYKKTDLPIPEPSQYSLEALVHTISDAFTLAKFRVGFTQPRTQDSLSVRIYQENVRFRFSPVLNDLFGINHDFMFHEKKTPILIPSALRNLDEKIQDVSTPTVWADYNQIYVHLDIIENQIIGSELLPVIKVIDSKPAGINERVVYRENPVLYVKLKKEDVSTVRVLLTDESCVPLPNNTYQTSVILHFKRKLL